MSGVSQTNVNSCDGNDDPPPVSIETNNEQGSIISSLSEAVPVANGECEPVLPHADMGLPKTPPCRMLFSPSEQDLAEGYDSDNQIGPFIGAGVEDEAYVTMDEAALEATAPPNDVSVDETEIIPDPVLGDDTIDKMKVAELRSALKERGMGTNGLKAVLIARLKEGVSNNVPIVRDRPVAEANNSAGEAFQPGAYWKLLEQAGPEVDESVMNVDGVRFRAPTTPAEEHASAFAEKPKKRNYSEMFDRRPFIAERLLPEKNDRGKCKRDKDGKYCYKKQYSDKTVPNLKYLFKNGVNIESHPADYFDLFFPRNRTKDTHPKAVCIDDLNSWTNTKAMMLNAGSRGGKYYRYNDFSKSELMSHLALYLLHGVSPSPQIEMKFSSQDEDPVNGSNLCHRVFGKGGITRHKEFKAFFATCNPTIPTPPTTSHPNWKVDPLLKHMMRVSKGCILIGRSISIDEMVVSFQGKHGDKQRITYKKAGDGFLVDALCSDGYTYTWYFRNQPAPKSWLDKGLSPLHSRVMSLLQQLPENTKNYVCGMDNLFMSPKFAKIAHNSSGRNVMIHGVCRPSRGIPQCVTQVALTKKEELLRTRGTVKASVLSGDSSCPNLVVVSFYDSKPVYFVSNACEKVEWRKKERKLWHADRGAKVKVPFFRLNLVDEYNYGMGNVDQADQLRLQYRIHYWLRNRKWWWAHFFWIFELSLTNAFVLYRMFHDIHEIKLPLTHYEFIKAVALAWIDQDTYWPVQTARRKKTTSSSCSTAAISDRSIITRLSTVPPAPKKSSTCSDRSLDPYNGALRCRLDTCLNHFPVENGKSEANCQLHFYTSRKKVRSQLMKCETCNVILCIQCYRKFHEIPNLKSQKI